MSPILLPGRAGAASRHLLLALLLPAIAVATTAGAPSLDEALDRVAPADGVLASDYVETRASSLLTEEIVVEGRIQYRPPRRLHKTEEGADGRRSIAIEDGTVRIDSGEEVRSFPLSRSRELESLMILLEAVARGDANRLRDRFTAEIEGRDDAWILHLEARAPAGSGNRKGNADRQPLRLRVTGDREGIDRIVLESSQSGRVTLELTGDGG